jgi:branched-chain amino acid transport system ATP-binding protein
MPRKFLEVRGLKKNFGGLQATNNLSLLLYEGDQTAIIGPNGAGKSTLFNLLTGYHRADAGTITYDGKDITSWSSYAIARAGVSRAFQISNIFPGLTVLENTRSAVQVQAGKAFDLFSIAKHLCLRETEEILELCDLRERSGVMAGELAQGDKKKLEVAIALAGKPKLLLLDEPTAGMSKEETKATMALVDRLNQDLNITILFTEHDMSVVFNHAREVALLHHGEILLQGAPDEVRANQTVRQIYLGEHE